MKRAKFFLAALLLFAAFSITPAGAEDADDRGRTAAAESTRVRVTRRARRAALFDCDPGMLLVPKYDCDPKMALPLLPPCDPDLAIRP
jgi:hypothetical protein